MKNISVIPSPALPTEARIRNKPDAICSLVLIGAFLFCGAWEAQAAILSPIAFGSVRDNPIDGVGDTIVSGAFIANFPSDGNVYSAILEYDVSAFAGQTLTRATLEGTIFVSNSLDTGDRIIEVLLFHGNGVIDTTDFQAPASSVGRVSYRPDPPLVFSVDFSFNVLSHIQALLDSGATRIGVRFAGVNQPQAPSELAVGWTNSIPPILTLTKEVSAECTSTFDFNFSGTEYTNCFFDLHRGAEITTGLDVGGTGHSALNFTGGAGAAGSTWLTMYDAGPAAIFGTEVLCADVLIERFNNGKGAGLVTLLHESVGRKGLALFIANAGNTDTLVLATVDANADVKSKPTTLTEVSLRDGINEKAWYRLIMSVDSAIPRVTGKVFTHTTATDPNSVLGMQVGSTLTYSPGTLPAGVASPGTNGIMASAIGAVVNSSVTNFTNDAALCDP